MYILFLVTTSTYDECFMYLKLLEHIDFDVIGEVCCVLALFPKEYDIPSAHVQMSNG